MTDTLVKTDNVDSNAPTANDVPAPAKVATKVEKKAALTALMTQFAETSQVWGSDAEVLRAVIKSVDLDNRMRAMFSVVSDGAGIGEASLTKVTLAGYEFLLRTDAGNPQVTIIAPEFQTYDRNMVAMRKDGYGHVRSNDKELTDADGNIIVADYKTALGRIGAQIGRIGLRVADDANSVADPAKPESGKVEKLAKRTAQEIRLDELEKSMNDKMALLLAAIQGTKS